MDGLHYMKSGKEFETRKTRFMTITNNTRRAINVNNEKMHDKRV